jgi:hypothetical protein
MFYFGSDDALSPLMVSQLKAIKDAGFQENTEVIVYFDASEKGVPTRLYNVNHARKALLPEGGRTQVGDGETSFVRNLAKDNIDPASLLDPKGLESTRPAAAEMFKCLKQPDSMPALQAFQTFLNYARENHPAKHYLLFLLGHGMIVGNDAFLPDEAPRSGIKLKDLGETLRKFCEPMEKGKETLELLALHSCSMSAIEVAYELQGTAKYMMASEGVSFVGGWPYRQVLKKIFNTIREANSVPDAEPQYNVEELLQKIYFLSLFCSTDFLLSGFSADLTLCNLDPRLIGKFKDAAGDEKGLGTKLIALVRKLKQGLENPKATELILLAHLKSQAYWNEMYADLYDFCRCLEEGCLARQADYGADLLLGAIAGACKGVTDELKTTRANPFDRLVVFSEHFGPGYQYSHGLSVYFPWAKPFEDANEKVLANYKDYIFTTQLKAESKTADPKADDSWLSFLQLYFQKTKRVSRVEEDKDVQSKDTTDPAVGKDGLKLVAVAIAAVGTLEAKAVGSYEGKASGATGASCGCPSVKNYSDFSISKAAALAFSPDSDPRDIPESRSARTPAASSAASS